MNFVLLYGPPAAGKLTVATELAKQTDYTVLDNHLVTDYLYHVFPRENPEYNPIRTKLGRESRLQLFAAVAEFGIDAITTFAPISKGMYDFIRDVKQSVEDNGGTFCLVQLMPQYEEIVKRVSTDSRKGKKVDTIERWHELIDNNPGAVEPFPDENHLIIDNTNLSPTSTAEKIIQHYKLMENA